ncbi:GntR family transcriptional regulator [Parazoarcus communis]|uniref:GntR family transcriptional regulator n=1 Tax=Parazoarcus communis TaxID=41977 RepID=A0A2U8H788_9RHOO|nr:GntR family transcriptional regulator [Parazoarcus communis]AWI80615.1 GntR family transcriptional regulator [Parazoarcus communis]
MSQAKKVHRGSAGDGSASGVTAISPVPLHTQIREVLRRQILDGTYPPHSQMPSESQMMNLFSVSRITIRQALGDLQKEGLIFKVMGKGSFVAKPKAFQSLSRLQGFGEAMSPSGYETYSLLMSARETEASIVVAQQFSIKPGTQVFEIQRLRYLNREPISVDVSYFPIDIGRRLVQEDLAARDIFVILENDFDLNLTHADLQIEAICADESLARHLGIAEGSPLLRMERMTYAGDVPVDFEFLYYRGDAFQYRLRIDRS